MIFVQSIAQPGRGTTLSAITSALEKDEISQIHIAAAYITLGGARDLVAAMSDTAGASWKGIRKRWLTSIDYFRTEPMALKFLNNLPNSKVRIHDGPDLLANKCIPLLPFHPKTFLIRGSGFDQALSGSGNISRSGLSRGHEAGLMVRVARKQGTAKTGGQQSMRSLRAWFRGLWREAAPLDDVLDAYRAMFEAAPNLRDPTPTEDDVAPTGAGAGSLTAENLRKLRVCRHFWIEAGSYVTKNRGKLPGNQLMLKRLSRVYFGVPPVSLPENSPLTALLIAYEHNEEKQCSLTFSDNSMEKLTLPIPGAGGPPRYENQNLLFTRKGPGRFQLRLGTKADKASWRKKSKAICADFTMSSGRKWGVF